MNISRFVVVMAGLALVGVSGTARAQYGYGWGGWGGAGATVGGSVGAGRGMAAAGAGAYNEQTAVARSMNAQTAQQWNDYMYAINQRNTANETARLQRRQQATNETLDATYKRLHDNPEPRDIASGDALNIVLTELVNPKIYTQVVQTSKQSIASQLVKNINFQYAANMILISLEDVQARAVPDELAVDPRFESDRQTIRALVAKGKQEGASENHPSLDTIRALRAAITAAKEKADGIYQQGTRQRSECDNFLKALIGLTKMLERPPVEDFLKGLNRYPETTLGQLISFMHTFNLRFGASKTPEQGDAYTQLYPLLVQLRDKAQAGGGGGGANPVAAARAPLPNPRGAMSLFSGGPAR